MSNIQEVTDSEFEATVLKADKPVLVDFWATWCGPCRMIAPIVEQIHGELGDKVKVVKMDIDENPSVPMQLGIMSIPTVIIFKDGKPAERTVGYRPSADLRFQRGSVWGHRRTRWRRSVLVGCIRCLLRVSRPGVGPPCR